VFQKRLLIGWWGKLLRMSAEGGWNGRNQRGRNVAGKIVLGLDPGPTQSALVSFDSVPNYCLLQSNEEILKVLQDIRYLYGDIRAPLVIEKIENQGMGAVGDETFETVYWSGRFAQAYGTDKVDRIGRKAVKLHICGSARANDSNIRCALIDRFGGKDAAIGKKSCPGPLYMIKSHLWAALAVAITAHDKSMAGI